MGHFVPLKIYEKVTVDIRELYIMDKIKLDIFLDGFSLIRKVIHGKNTVKIMA